MKNIIRMISLSLCALLLASPAMALAQEGEEELSAVQVISQATALDLTPYEGKAIYLNFFTEWCHFCMQEMPDIKKVFETYDPEELQIVLIHVWDGEDASNTENIKATYGMEEMTFFEDEDRFVSYALGLQGYPLSVFIGKDGNVHMGQSGMMSYDQMAQAMEEMGVAKAGPV